MNNVGLGEFGLTLSYGSVAVTVKQEVSSAQRVPEPDPLPGISFDTRPDPIQFEKSSGSG